MVLQTQGLSPLGFISARSDTSLFILRSGKDLLYLLVYVDDIIITGSNSGQITSLIHTLHETFSIKDLGTLHYFLGIETKPHPSGLHLSQERYITSIIKKANMHNAKPRNTPLQAGVQLSKTDGAPL